MPLLVALHTLAPPLLASQTYWNVDNVVDHLTGHLDLRTLTRDLIRTFKCQQLATFVTDAPAYIWPHLPILLNQHMSEGLLCMSHHCHEQWLPSPYF